LRTSKLGQLTAVLLLLAGAKTPPVPVLVAVVVDRVRDSPHQKWTRQNISALPPIS
jgi:hypothetical protein